MYLIPRSLKDKYFDEDREEKLTLCSIGKVWYVEYLNFGSDPLESSVSYFDDHLQALGFFELAHDRESYYDLRFELGKLAQNKNPYPKEWLCNGLIFGDEQRCP
jgi:hypothetical protein